jgi:glycosyltransferase involved in cell wall biosynthesis
MAYERAERIISLYSGNASLQIEFGASEEKIEIIPNGIEPNRFETAFETRSELRKALPHRKVIGFIGRIVPIKDVKTLIRAMGRVLTKIPDAELHVFGPTEEDPDYVQDCKELAATLHLEKKIHFLGSKQVEQILPQIDLLVLTSISEALPLVILEGFAGGVPVVTSDVGACRELIHGRIPEDKALGRGGILTGIASPLETADALIALLRSRELQDKMGRAGLERVRKFYRQEDIVNRYRNYYRSYIENEIKATA